MPTYEYKREDGSVFEFSQSINDAPLKTCPETGQAVKRIISGGGGVVYKGTGWYVTDYKNGNERSNGSANQKSEPKAEEKKDTASKE
jgi:putative FmdB family regulatory protein